MAAAIFGLIGVLLGGLIAGAAQWWMTTRAERAAKKTAARLVSIELDAFRDLLRQWARLERWVIAWWEPPSAWSEHREVLAKSLTASEWESVRRAYERLASMDESVRDLSKAAEDLRETRSSAPRCSESAAVLESDIQVLSRAVDVLGPVTGAKPTELTKEEAERLEDTRTTIDCWLTRHEREPACARDLEVDRAVEALIAVAGANPDALHGLGGGGRATCREILVRIATRLERAWPEGSKRLAAAAGPYESTHGYMPQPETHDSL